jgi:hypothetical protein
MEKANDILRVKEKLTINSEYNRKSNTNNIYIYRDGPTRYTLLPAQFWEFVMDIYRTFTEHSRKKTGKSSTVQTSGGTFCAQFMAVSAIENTRN